MRRFVSAALVEAPGFCDQSLCAFGSNRFVPVCKPGIVLVNERSCVAKRASREIDADSGQSARALLVSCLF